LKVHKSNEIISKDDNSVTTSSPVKIGDYIVGDTRNSYLRKVNSVTKTSAGYVANTTKASLGEVFSNLDFSTSYRLENVRDNFQASTRTRKGDNYQVSSYKWKSGSILFSSKKNSFNRQSRKITSSSSLLTAQGNFYKIKSPRSFSVNLNDKLKYKLDISKISNRKYYYYDSFINNENKCASAGGTYDYIGINECLNITPKICSVKGSIKDVNNLGSNNLPIITEENGNYYIEWTPIANNIAKSNGGNYLMNITLRVGGGSCKKLTIENVNLNNITLIAGDDISVPLQIASADKASTFKNADGTIEFENKLSASFVPKLYFGGKFADKSLDTASAMLKTTFNISDLAKLTMTAKKKHTFTPLPLYTKGFIKILMAGPVPIVITGQIKFMMVADVESSASIVSSIDTNSVLQLDYV